MKKLRALGLAILILAVTVAFVGCDSASDSDFPTATEKFFVNDFADVISSSDEELIYSAGVALQEKTTAQVVVATVDTIGDYEISEYALELARKWEIGTEKDDNGILILLSVSDREVYIAVGYGLEGAMPDSKTGRILDNYGVDYFAEDNFSEGLVSVYKAVANEISFEYGIEIDDSYIPVEMLPEDDSDGKEIVISWVVLMVIVAIYLTFFKKRFFIIGGSHHNHHHHGGFGGFGGGFSGGSSGGFSGGGGSFGGGGAGRGF